MHSHIAYQGVKRAIDFTISTLSIIGLSPFLLIIGLAVKIDSPGPAIFSQWRVGRGHRLFKVYKFRTMQNDADRHYQYLIDKGEIFIQRENDPRLTRLGYWLRRLSLDELPQLFNIFMGDMSFVGPRPLVLREHNQLPAITLKRLNALPGLAGYAQVEGRSNASLPDRFARDLYYVDHVSFMMDLRILFGALTAVLRKESAF